MSVVGRRPSPLTSTGRLFLDSEGVRDLFTEGAARGE